ncbi:glycosyltransferase family 2 protein, partial [bacterium]|nr:glycosyltransferase family 2 protein [bacterium]
MASQTNSLDNVHAPAEQTHVTPVTIAVDLVLVAIFFYKMFGWVKSHVPSNNPAFVLFFGASTALCVTGVFWMAIQMFRAQTYPQERMEWIVLDDGADKVGDLFAASGLKNVRYIALPDGERLKIGAKRNRLNKLAKGDICVCWDDDDYYPPERIRKAVTKLCAVSGRRVPVAGCSKLYLYYADRREIWSIGPYNPNHCTNGTMAYWRTYTKDHHYDDNAEKAEERQFMDDWKTSVVQMDPDDVMLVICHSRNTFDKRKLLEKHNPTMKKTDFKIKRFVKEKKIAEFYNSLMADFTDEKPGPVAAPTPEELNPALQFVGRPDASATPMESPSTVPTLEVSELPPPIALPEHPAP